MLLLIFTVLMTWRAEVWIPGVRSKITLTDTFIFIGVLMLGPWAATLIASIDGLAKSPRGAKSMRVATVGVNMAAMNLAVLRRFAACRKSCSGRSTALSTTATGSNNFALALGVIALINYLVNTALVALVLAASAGAT